MLINAGASARVRDDRGDVVSESALHWLIAFDHDEQERAVQLLKKGGAELKADITWNHPTIDPPGAFPLGSPLHFAVHCHQPHAIDTLLRSFSGSNHINFPGSSDRTPLAFAAQLHWHDVVSQLIEAGALDDTDANDEVLHWISILPRHEEWAVAGILHSTLPDTAILCAEELLARRHALLEVPDELGYMPIMIASYHHKKSLVKCFIDAQCAVDARTPPENDGRTALSLYADNRLSDKSEDILNLLHAAGADLESPATGGKTVLHFAARNDVHGVAERLLYLGSRIDATTDYGETPLHVAAQYNSCRVGRLLLDQGANPASEHWRGTLNEQDWNGLTPIACAVSKRHKKFINLLLEYNVEPLARPATGDTVIHFAVSESTIKSSEFVLGIPRIGNRRSAE